MVWVSVYTPGKGCSSLDEKNARGMRSEWADGLVNYLSASAYLGADPVRQRRARDPGRAAEGAPTLLSPSGDTACWNNHCGLHLT